MCVGGVFSITGPSEMNTCSSKWIFTENITVDFLLISPYKTMKLAEK